MKWLRLGETRRLNLTTIGFAQIAAKRLKVNSLHVGSVGGNEQKPNNAQLFNNENDPLPS